MDREELERLQSLTDQALVDKYSVKWRELAPILISRIPDLIETIKRRDHEIGQLQTQINSFGDALRQKDEALQEFVASLRVARGSLGSLWDQSLSDTEALARAVDEAMRDLRQTAMERDLVSEELRQSRQIVGEQSARIEELTRYEEILGNTRKEMEELSIQLSVHRTKEAIVNERVAELESSILTTEERFDVLRANHTEETDVLREELRLVQAALNTALGDVEKWRERAMEAEQQADRLAGQIQDIQASLTTLTQR